MKRLTFFSSHGVGEFNDHKDSNEEELRVEDNIQQLQVTKAEVKKVID